MLDFALDYLKRGFSIIPLLPKDKRPAIKWEEFQKRQPTEKEINGWFNEGNKNIGIVTGKVSGITVIDFDGKEAVELAKSQGMPKTPLVKTGKDYGYHAYCKFHEKLRNFQARADLKNIDLRSEGGYVVAPPSIHPNGTVYRWTRSLDLPFSSIPAWLEDAILNNLPNSVFKNLNNININNCIFGANRKDIDLIHVAFAMQKGRLEPEYMQESIERIIKSWGEDDPKWAAQKVLSALKRGERREASLADEVREWVLSSSGVFFSSEINNFLHLSSLDDQKNLSTILRRLKDEGIIERANNKNGCWRKKDTEIEKIDLWEGEDENLVPVKFPLRVHELCGLYPKSIAVIAGVMNQGKSAMAMNMVVMNQKLGMPIHYFSSEMGKQEIRNRFKKFGLSKENLKLTLYDRSSNFEDVIDPNGLNIIDYIEIHETHYLVGKILDSLYRKLETGIVIACLQKTAGKELGRGGDFSLEKPRIYLTLDNNICKIVKGKIWIREDLNPNKMIMNFKLVDGLKFIEVGNWHNEIEKKDMVKGESWNNQF